MQVNTERRLAGLKDKVPDIEKTLQTVQFLSGRKVRFHLPPHIMLELLTKTRKMPNP